MSGSIILWDFDGTLAYRRGGWSGALAELAELEGILPLTEAERFRPYLQQGYPWHTAERHHPELTDPDAWWRAMRPVFAAAFVGVGAQDEQAVRLAAAMRERYLLPAAFSVFDDVDPVLTALTRLGWRHVVLSNHVPELPRLIEQIGIGHHFQAIITSAAIGYEKPHPESYQIALDVAGNPDRAWMVGDNYTADVAGAERAGLRAILVRGEDVRASLRCPGLLGIPAIVGSAI